MNKCTIDFFLINSHHTAENRLFHPSDLIYFITFFRYETRIVFPSNRHNNDNTSDFIYSTKMLLHVLKLCVYTWCSNTSYLLNHSNIRTMHSTAAPHLHTGPPNSHIHPNSRVRAKCHVVGAEEREIFWIIIGPCAKCFNRNQSVLVYLGRALIHSQYNVLFQLDSDSKASSHCCMHDFPVRITCPTLRIINL